MVPERRRETRGLVAGEEEGVVTGMRWSAASSEKNSRMKARRPWGAKPASLRRVTDTPAAGLLRVWDGIWLLRVWDGIWLLRVWDGIWLLRVWDGIWLFRVWDGGREMRREEHHMARRAYTTA
jgi:hypothetical protein